MIDTHVGPYRIVEMLGEGGTGIVYRAIRDDAAYHAEVAVKVLKLELASEYAIARFRDERQVLATLEHRSIVRLLDGGTLPDGRPYLILELVAGTPIAKHVRELQLPLRERIGLAIQTCDAVQYAHGKLVVHRDLKPSNILVSSDGIVKLLDFGSTRVAGQFTPMYASPEQVRGEAVAVATDVYSLGVVLYELIADRTPFAEHGALELLRAISETVPPPPSTHRPEARGELDTIVRTAMHERVERRYGSVLQLAADLRSYLAGMPIAARAPTAAYRLRKFVGRHRVGVAVTSLAIAALATSTVTSIVQTANADAQAARAEREVADVRSLANSIVFEVDEKVRDLAGSTAVREVMVSRALVYLDRLGRDADDVVLSRELARAYMRIGDIQGNPYEPNLGHPADALRSYARALAIAETLVARDPTNDEGLAIRRSALIGRGIIALAQDRLQDARTLLGEGLAEARRLPEPRDYDPWIMRGHYGLAVVERHHDPTVALATLQAMIEIATRWVAATPNANTRYALGTAYSSHGEMLAMSAADPDGALREYHIARGLLSNLAAEYPHDARFSREVGLIDYLTGLAQAGFGLAELWVGAGAESGAESGEPKLRAGLEVAESLMRGGDTRAASLAFENMIVLAAARSRRDPAAAVEELDRALALLSTFPDNERAAFTQVEWFAHCARAAPLVRVGRSDDAVAAATLGLAITERSATTGDDEDAMHLQMCRAQVAAMYLTLDKPEAALSLLDAARAVLEDRVRTRPQASSSYVGIAAIIETIAPLRPHECSTLYDHAIATWQKWSTPTPFVKREISRLGIARVACR